MYVNEENRRFFECALQVCESEQKREKHENGSNRKSI